MYLVKTPKFIQSLFPNYAWNIPTKEKVMYLTFDDGPIPEVTPWVMDQLDKYNAKATFFCVGENIQRYTELFDKLIERGHSVGNHTMNHLNGWTSENIPYFHNIRHGANLANSDLFRPPYGRLKPSQAQFLQRHYKIVMWDVLSGDFDPNLSPEDCVNNVLKNAREGSIVVFHDSLKSWDRMSVALPQVLAYFAGNGYRFEAIPMQKLEESKKVVKRMPAMAS